MNFTENNWENNWFKYYTPPDSTFWQGRVDSHIPERYNQVIKLIDLLENNIPEDDHYSFVIIGFASDEGVRRNQGRVGASLGPDKIRKLLANLPFNFADQINVYDIGNINCHDQNLEAAQMALASIAELVLLAGCHPIVIGGGHETAYGHYLGIAKTDHTENLGIINFDAHFDLRPLIDSEVGMLGTSGSPFLQIAIDRENEHLDFDYFCIGIQPMANTLSLYEEADMLGVEYIEAQELTNPGSQNYINKYNKFIDFVNNHESLYVSICLDVFSSGIAPGVSAPQPLGILPQNIMIFLNLLAASNKVISLDIVELAPNYDQDNSTARLGALLIADYINTVCNTDSTDDLDNLDSLDDYE